MANPERMRRGRLLLLAVIVLAMVAVTTSLGVWQMRRLQWKTDLIAHLARVAAEPAAPLPPVEAWLSLAAADEFRRFTLRDAVPAGEAAQVFVAASALRDDIAGPGVMEFQPMRLQTGETVVVNRGYVPRHRPATACVSPPPAGEAITGYLRWPEQPGLFGAPGRGRDGLWLAFDHKAMAAGMRWGAVAPFYLDKQLPDDGCYPRPANLHPRLSNPHLGYAVTWFGLALAVAAGFAAFWRAQCRPGHGTA